MKVFTIFWLLLFAIGSFFLFYGGLDHQAFRSVKELWNIGHIVYFALTVYLLAKLGFLKKVPLPYLWLGFLLLSLLWGTLIEVLQYDTQRTPDLADIVRDLTGCLLVLAFHPGLLKFPGFVGRVIIRLVVSSLFIIQLIPLTVALVDEITAHFQFPVLSNFETPYEIGRWDGGAGREVVQLDPESDSFQLKIRLTTSTYSGVGMKYFPADWSGYKSVNLKFFIPYDKLLRLVIKIYDAQHELKPNAYAHRDRFNKSVELNPGWNEITIPLSSVESAPRKRNMDLSQIRGISFFTIRLPDPRVIYLDSISLQ